jgi:hypothetical protein
MPTRRTTLQRVEIFGARFASQFSPDKAAPDYKTTNFKRKTHATKRAWGARRVTVLCVLQK